jgi:hypothetical protein
VEVTKAEGAEFMHGPEIKVVKMVRGIRNAHYEKIKDLSPQEKFAFFREKASALHAELGRPEELFRNTAPKAHR